MKLEIFNAHKDGIREAMQSALIMSKYRGEAMHKYCLIRTYDVIEIRKADTKEDIIAKLEEVVRYTKEYGAPKIDFVKHREHCTSKTISTTYAFAVYKMRDKIEESQVSTRMKLLVKKELGLGKWADLECRVMALYKAGHIGWEEVQSQHGVSCTL